MSLFTRLFLFLLLLFVATALASAYSRASKPQVVFDSNSTGSFSIQSINLDGSNRRVLYDSPDDDVLPDVSPDGSSIVFVRLNPETKAHDLWLIDLDGSNPRLLLPSGMYPNFSADGRRVFFERGRNTVMVVDIATKAVREFFPNGVKEFSDKEIALPKVSPDERYIAVTIDYPYKWKTWVHDFKTGEFFMMGHGCQGEWLPDSKELYWVERGRFKSASAISRFNVAKRSNTVIQDAGPPHGQEYFPHVSANGDLLLWAASPVDEHSHDTGNYQLYYRDLKSGEVVRLTHDEHTNRWPQLVPEASES